MAKLARKKQKIFGSTGDTSQFGQIGSDAAGTPTTTKDIDTIQSLAQYLSGLYAITADLNAPPRGQDMNALYHLITRQLAYLFEAGVPEWEAATEYSSLTSLVLHGGNVWLSLSNSNIGNTPALGSVHWRKVIDQYGTARESVSTSSRILDLTGDRVPAIPDDPAGVTYFQDSWATTDRWGVNGASLSVSGGILKATGTGGAFDVNRTISFSAKLFTARLKASKDVTVSLRGSIGGTANTPISSVVLKAGVWSNINTYIPGSAAYIYFYCPPIASGDTLEIDWVYIGTGAYLSKLVDRAGVPWTNYGALPVDGPFGKGLQFPGNSYLQASGPMTGIVGTIAIHGKHKANGAKQICFFNDNGSGLNGQRVYISSANKISFLIGGVSAFTQKENDTLADGEEYTQVVTFEGTTYKYSVNGGPVTTGTLVQAPGLSSVNAWIGRTTIGTEYNVGTIYAFRADSRVWTDEEIARWSRDPYSEESIPMSSTPSTHSLALRDDAGRMQAADGSANLDVVNKGQLDLKVSKAGDSMTGALAMGGNKVTGLAASSSNGDAVRHEQLTALDSAVMKLSGNQTAAGIKTFSSIPVLPASDPTTDNQAARKAYVDTKLAVSDLGSGWATALGTSLGSNWAAALDANLGAGWATALGTSLGSNWAAALDANLGAGWGGVFQGADPLLSLYGITGPGDYIIPGWGAVDNIIGNDNLLASLQATSSSFLETPDGYKVSFTGNIRARFFIQTINSSSTVYGRIYINGVGVGTEHSLTGSAGTSGSFFFTDISVSDGDLVESRIRVTGGGNAYRSSFALCGNGAGRKYQTVFTV